jgi:hypothetical protein
MLASITQNEVRAFLTEQMPTAAPAEIERASSALVLIIKLASAAPTPSAKPATKKQRQYKEKPVAETLKLKR